MLGRCWGDMGRPLTFSGRIEVFGRTEAVARVQLLEWATAIRASRAPWARHMYLYVCTAVCENVLLFDSELPTDQTDNARISAYMSVMICCKSAATTMGLPRSPSRRRLSFAVFWQFVYYPRISRK